MIKEKQSICVLIVSASQKFSDSINGFFPQSFFCPPIMAKCASEAKRKMLEQSFDIIIINAPLTDTSASEFALEISDDISRGILLIVKNDIYDEVSYSVSESGIYTLSKPTSHQSFVQAIRLIAATNQRLKKVERKNENLRFKMEEIRTVNHAKWVLIKKLGLSEDDAHRAIEKQAMDMRTSKKEIAESIIKTYEN